MGFPSDSAVKNLPVMQETQVQSLGWEDPLREHMANPLQYSCLESPKDRGAWQAAVHGVTESDTTEVTEPQPMLEERLNSKFYKVREVREKTRINTK